MFMKKLGIVLCGLVAAMIVLPLFACSGKLEDETFRFELNENADGYILTYYKKHSDKSALVLPDTFKKLPVTEIKDNVFHQAAFTSVTIPGTIKYIGIYAFEDCRNLTEVVIESGVEIIGAYAFIQCANLASVQIPETVRVISISAFQDCASLESVAFPESVTTVSSSVFNGCYELKAFHISDTVTSIGARAFAYCRLLEEIIIPDSVTEIGKYAFWGCETLKKVKLSDNLKTIEAATFNYCGALESISIPDSVIVIEDLAFVNCYAIQQIDLGDSVETIGYQVFGTAGPDYIILPKSIRFLGEAALPYHALVFYMGAPAQWEEVEKDSTTDPPHFYSATENLEIYGTYNQRYWYFNSDNRPTFWRQDEDTPNIDRGRPAF